MARRNGSTEMATDTTEITASELPTAESNGTETEATKNTRERVDLDSLPADEAVTVTVKMPAGLKRQLIKLGEEQNKNASVVLLQWAAERAEYNVPQSFIEVTRKGQYASEDERKAATAAKQEDTRKTMAAIVAAMQAGAIDPALLEQFKSKVVLPKRNRKSKDAE